MNPLDHPLPSDCIVPRSGETLLFSPAQMARAYLPTFAVDPLPIGVLDLWIGMPLRDTINTIELNPAYHGDRWVWLVDNVADMNHEEYLSRMNPYHDESGHSDAWEKAQESLKNRYANLRKLKRESRKKRE